MNFEQKVAILESLEFDKLHYRIPAEDERNFLACQKGSPLNIVYASKMIKLSETGKKQNSRVVFLTQKSVFHWDSSKVTSSFELEKVRLIVENPVSSEFFVLLSTGESSLYICKEDPEGFSQALLRQAKLNHANLRYLVGSDPQIKLLDINYGKMKEQRVLELVRNGLLAERVV